MDNAYVELESCSESVYNQNTKIGSRSKYWGSAQTLTTTMFVRIIKEAFTQLNEQGRLLTGKIGF